MKVVIELDAGQLARAVADQLELRRLQARLAELEAATAEAAAEREQLLAGAAAVATSCSAAEEPEQAPAEPVTTDAGDRYYGF